MVLFPYFVGILADSSLIVVNSALQVYFLVIFGKSGETNASPDPGIFLWRFGNRNFLTLSRRHKYVTCTTIRLVGMTTIAIIHAAL